MPKVIKKSKADEKQAELSISPTNLFAMLVLLIIALLVGWGFDLARSNRTAKNATPAVASVQSIVYDGQDGKNALDLLKANNKIETQDSSIGTFVTSINNVKNTDNQYWMFYVNGDLASTASDQYQTKNSDKIEWRYQDIGSFSAN